MKTDALTVQRYASGSAHQAEQLRSLLPPPPRFCPADAAPPESFVSERTGFQVRASLPPRSRISPASRKRTSLGGVDESHLVVSRDARARRAVAPARTRATASREILLIFRATSLSATSPTLAVFHLAERLTQAQVPVRLGGVRVRRGAPLLPPGLRRGGAGHARVRPQGGERRGLALRRSGVGGRRKRDDHVRGGTSRDRSRILKRSPRSFRALENGRASASSPRATKAVRPRRRTLVLTHSSPSLPAAGYRRFDTRRRISRDVRQARARAPRPPGTPRGAPRGGGPRRARGG